MITNVILINATLLLVHFFIMSKIYVYIYVLYALFFSSIILCALLSYVNTCACHAYFTINLLTYLFSISDNMISIGKDKGFFTDFLNIAN